MARVSRLAQRPDDCVHGVSISVSSLRGDLRSGDEGRAVDAEPQDLDVGAPGARRSGAREGGTAASCVPVFPAVRGVEGGPGRHCQAAIMGNLGVGVAGDDQPGPARRQHPIIDLDREAGDPRREEPGRRWILAAGTRSRRPGRNCVCGCASSRSTSDGCTTRSTTRAGGLHCYVFPELFTYFGFTAAL